MLVTITFSTGCLDSNFGAGRLNGPVMDGRMILRMRGLSGHEASIAERPLRLIDNVDRYVTSSL